MKAVKVTVCIKAESLSIDTLRSQLMQVVDQVEQEAEEGELTMADGDHVEWTTDRKPVEF